ncbi:hypothetical protein BD324DRAFT_630452 [Kockovaella imperatae]|uniref:F-box domain-containing protein n=1 Tax=Kockovaella imperatae TaxID=4999 RepID=A0A1Y1UDQ3_9TREE|nr:hypothetical protein BD324DRAFT_630452 [Kockovaella imperatae]ORX36170.1 hypothetical protein BD324DRAFT_630452 [Kockovaella imperatae]
MDITLLPPTAILSNHSHLAVLPSAFPRRIRGQVTPSGHPHLSSAYRPRRRSFPCPPPPMDGRCMVDELPDEILVNILCFLDWDQVLHLRSVSRRWSNLALSPTLHQSLTLLALPPTPLPYILRIMLQNIRHLHLHLFPYPTSIPGATHPTTALLTLLDAIPPDQLISLSLPFSAPYLPGSDLGKVLKRIGGRLEHLDLRGSGLVGSKWTQWIKWVGKNGHGLRSLDLSFTSISTLPGCPTPTSPLRPFRNPRTLHTALPLTLPVGITDEDILDIDPFRNLRVLSLSSCAYLSEQVLSAFLARLPPLLQRLDVSRLESITFEALWNLRVVNNAEAHDPWLASSASPTSLIDIKVVGIDHLTRLDIRRLKHHWEAQRHVCVPPAPAPATIPQVAWKVPKTPPMKARPLSPPPTPSPPDNSRRMSLMDAALGGALDAKHVPPYGLPTPPDSGSSSDEMDIDDIDPIAQLTHINIVHSAILESEDVDGYRRFIGEVAGGVVRPSAW